MICETESNRRIVKVYHTLQPDSKRCRAKCPGCSGICSLINNHVGYHTTKIHRVNTNNFMVKKRKFNGSCDMECNEHNSHMHIEGCQGLCYNNYGRKHSKKKRNLDSSLNTYEVDIVRCVTWWDNKKWTLDYY